MKSKSTFPKLNFPAVLSPMAGVTDVAFRTLAKKYGAGMTYTEFVSSAAIVRGNKESLKLLEVDASEKPVAVQLFGSNVEEVIQAAQFVEEKFDVIDINCGCPAWKVIKTGSGSAMLNNPELIGNFVNKLASSINKPVTVKIRTGINKNKINAVEIAKIVEDCGGAAIAVHGRTQKQGYTGKANWDIIKEVKEKVNIPVIGNGDVFSPEDFKEKLEYSKVDAIMIARGAIGNPYIFQQIKDYLDTGSYQKENIAELEKLSENSQTHHNNALNTDIKNCYSNPSRIQQFFEYLEIARKYNISFRTLKLQSFSFTKGISGGGKLRTQLDVCKNSNELVDILKIIN